ncbi:MAG: circadian clock KaiB family protein [Myxococcota bacterium]
MDPADDVAPEPIVAPRLRVRLYVAGESPNSLAALTTLRRGLARLPAGDVELEVLDVLRDPERGAKDGVFMVPMLVRLSPLPERRVLGSLQERALLASVLGLEEASRD